jgi:hypothetical protein
MSVRIDCMAARQLAAAMLELPDVLGVDLTGPQSVVVRAHRPQQFFTELAQRLAKDSISIQRLEMLDASTQAVLDYVLKT